MQIAEEMLQPQERFSGLLCQLPAERQIEQVQQPNRYDDSMDF
jgi:hypothetical protein